ncbi:MAG: 5'/3'-nucleotidase SurE [Bdellovibrionales bacterium]|nr:5'/3'-nucleotidase SurE [Bdellovibrionales bacterium]
MSMQKKKIQILVSNDDGVSSPGIQALSKALMKVGHVTVVAPEREQSTMGHALTLHKPVRLFKVASEPGRDQWATRGTPADCVYLGIRQVLKCNPDIIVTGINNGVNVGNDIYYSGTVAAAREGAVMNIPAIATSLDYHFEVGAQPKANFEDCAEYIVGLVKQVLKNGLPTNAMLNVNFPNVPFNKIKGTKVARQGFRIYTDKITEKFDNRNKPYYWLGGTYAGFRPIEGSDCEVLDQDYISITPCRLDITQYEIMASMSQWDILPAHLKSKGKGKTKAKAPARNRSKKKAKKDGVAAE